MARPNRENVKRVVEKGKAFIERRPISREECVRGIDFRNRRIQDIDQQMARLQEERDEHTQAKAKEQALVSAIDANGDFSE